MNLFLRILVVLFVIITCVLTGKGLMKLRGKMEQERNNSHKEKDVFWR